MKQVLFAILASSLLACSGPAFTVEAEQVQSTLPDSRATAALPLDAFPAALPAPGASMEPDAGTSVAPDATPTAPDAGPTATLDASPAQLPPDAGEAADVAPDTAPIATPEASTPEAPPEVDAAPCNGPFALTPQDFDLDAPTGGSATQVMTFTNEGQCTTTLTFAEIG